MQRCSSTLWISLILSHSVGSGAFAKIHEALLSNRKEVTRRVLDVDKALSAVEEFAARALAKLPEWRIKREGWAALELGLRRVYSAGQRAGFGGGKLERGEFPRVA
jgi:hypothetical protein